MLITSNERIVMTLPLTAQFVDPAARDAAIASLRLLLGARLSNAAPVCEQHGKDASYHPSVAPDAAAFARSTEEEGEIVKICAHHKVPLIPFRAGTGLERYAAAFRGGVCFGIAGLEQVVQVIADDVYTAVGATGVHQR